MPWRANNTEDQEAVERHAAFHIGIFSDPIYKTGDWPKIMTDTLPPAILLRFTEEEKKYLLGLSCSYIFSDCSPPHWAQCTSN
jgi:beta-glucosidase